MSDHLACQGVRSPKCSVSLLQQGPSYVERKNLTLKIARFHGLTLAFSRKLANLKAAVALHFWFYNFCLIHRSLRMTPAMAAGITHQIWELGELI